MIFFISKDRTSMIDNFQRSMIHQSSVHVHCTGKLTRVFCRTQDAKCRNAKWSAFCLGLASRHCCLLSLWLAFIWWLGHYILLWNISSLCVIQNTPAAAKGFYMTGMTKWWNIQCLKLSPGIPRRPKPRPLPKTYPKTPERGIDKALPSLGIIYTPTQKVSGKLITIR